LAGFGRSTFGKGPFGKSDVGRDLLIELFPEEYFDESLSLDPGETTKDNDKDPLLKVLKTYSHLINNRRVEIDDMETIIDSDRARQDLLILLGRTFGLNVDKNEPESLQRLLVGNASQWLQIKSTVKGYSVRGLASGFNVFVTNFWRADLQFRPFIPFRNHFYLKPKRADTRAVPIFHVDVPPGSFPGLPLSETNEFAKSSYIRVQFQVIEPRESGIDFNVLFDLIVDKIFDVVGIHHELRPPQLLVEIPVDVGENVTIIINEEIEEYNFNEFNRFDIVEADVTPLDEKDGIVVFSGFGASVGYSVNEFVVVCGAEIDCEYDEELAMGAGLSLSAGIVPLGGIVLSPIVGETFTIDFIEEDTEEIIIEVHNSPPGISFGIEELTVKADQTAELTIGSEVQTIEEQTEVPPVIGEVVTVESVDAFLDASLNVTVDPFLSQVEGLMNTSLDVTTLFEIEDIEGTVVIPVSVFKSFSFDEMNGETESDIDADQNISTEINEHQNYDQDLSLASQIIVGDEINIPVDVFSEAEIEPVDAIMDADINVTAAIEIDGEGEAAIQVSIGKTSSVDEIEEIIGIQIVASNASTLEKVDGILDADLNLTVQIDLDTIASVIIPVSVSKTSTIDKINEINEIEVAALNTSTLEKVDGVLDADLNLTAQIDIDAIASVIIPVAVNETASIDELDEDLEATPNASNSSSIVKIDGELDANLNLTAQFDVDIEGQMEIPVNVDPYLTLVVGEQAGVDSGISGLATIEPVDAELSVDASIGINIDIDGEGDLLEGINIGTNSDAEAQETSLMSADAPILVEFEDGNAGAVIIPISLSIGTVSNINEVLTTSVSGAPSISIISEEGGGLLGDPLPNFDITISDTIALDGGGTAEGTAT